MTEEERKKKKKKQRSILETEINSIVEKSLKQLWIMPWKTSSRTGTSNNIRQGF